MYFFSARITTGSSQHSSAQSPACFLLDLAFYERRHNFKTFKTLVSPFKMEARHNLQTELQISLHEACKLSDTSTDRAGLLSFKRTFHRLDHALSTWANSPEGGNDGGSCSDEIDIQSRNDGLHLEAATLSSLISVLTEVELPSAYIKINISIEALYYRVLHSICDTVQKFIQDPLGHIDMDKVIDKVASLILEEEGGCMISGRDTLLLKLLQIVTSNLIDSARTKPQSDTIEEEEVFEDGEEDGYSRHSLLTLAAAEAVELARLEMQCSIRRITQAFILSDEYKYEEDIESLISVQLHIFLGFIFQHLSSLNLPFHDILQLQYTTIGSAVDTHEKAKTDSLVQQYLALVEAYLKETIEQAANLNYHSLQSLYHEIHKMIGGSQLDIHQTTSIVNSCIRHTMSALGMIEIIHVELKVTKPQLDDLIATLWISFGELVACVCSSDVLGNHSTVCDEADDLLFRLQKMVHVSVSFRDKHEKEIHGATFTTLSRLLHCLDSRRGDALEHEQWLDLLLNQTFIKSNLDVGDSNGSAPTSCLNDILFFMLHYLVTHEGQSAPYLMEKVMESDQTGESEEEEEVTKTFSFSTDPLNPWSALITTKLNDHMGSASEIKVIPPTNSVSTSSSVSDLSSFPKKRQRQVYGNTLDETFVSH